MNQYTLCRNRPVVRQSAIQAERSCYGQNPGQITLNHPISPCCENGSGSARNDPSYTVDFIRLD